MPYDVIGAVLGLVALIAAGMARQSINKAARLEHKMDDLLIEVSALRGDLQTVAQQLRREKKKRGAG